MPPTQAVPATNRLLAALPRKDRQHLLASCEPVELMLADILGNPGDPIRYVYFPTDSVVSSVMPIDGGAGLEVRLIGNEGMLGSSAMLGIELLPLRARVQETGSALRIKVPELQRVVIETPNLRRQLLLYFSSVLAQLGQTAACAVFHVVEARIAYWLLMTHDRSGGDRFMLTHDVLAHMLGVRRSGVTTAAGLLQARDLISYTRGHVSILDREGLEQAACDCYWTVSGTLRPVQPCAVSR